MAPLLLAGKSPSTTGADSEGALTLNLHRFRAQMDQLKGCEDFCLKAKGWTVFYVPYSSDEIALPPPAGKSPSTTGAGSEGALTKGPFNML